MKKNAFLITIPAHVIITVWSVAKRVPARKQFAHSVICRVPQSDVR